MRRALALLFAAACTQALVDECADRAKSDLCNSVGQVCQDPDTAVPDNFVCRCQLPATATKAGAPVDECPHDECTEHATACRAAGQKCTDPDLLKLHNWVCECIPPQAGTTRNQQPASCRSPPGDCDVHGRICTAAGQVCVDGALNDGKFTCECLPPATGVPAQQAPAVCLLDECVVVCPHCAQTQQHPQSVCETAGQTCKDDNQDPLSTQDWRCVCSPPSTGSKLIAAGACELNDCVAKCATCADTGSGNVCERAGQTCVERDLVQSGDWECHCVTPAFGTARGKPSVCDGDDCRVGGWQDALCVSAGQTCVDPDKLTPGDWACTCNTTAACLLDECAADCATCPKRRCADAGQTCEDADQAPTSLGDWRCTCAPPSSTTAVGNAAVCVVDECLERGDVCRRAGQTCVDPNHAATQTGDWECVCPRPTTGVALGLAAECSRDECREHGHVCTDKGQTCVDPAKLPGSLGDWECHCIPPATQVQHGAPAVCQHVGGCSDPTISDVCTSVGQSCVDSSATAAGAWACECVAPSTGQPRLRGPAACVLDECRADCGTCAQGTCARAHQHCVDTNLDPVTGLRTWECRCAAPQSGSKALARADCTLDECALYGSTCTAASQDCADPDAATRGDWRCVCRAPSTGQRTRAAAACVVDECVANGMTCTAAGQMCFDVSKAATSLGDWECRCTEPRVGSAVGRSVEPWRCQLDECKLYGDVCTNAGQTCVDDEKEIDGFWFCVCPDGKYRGDQQAAKCAFDECVEVGATTAVPVKGQPNACEQKGQTCVDMNTLPSVLRDWRCVCPAPNTEIFAVAAIALCKVDECKVARCPDGQMCVDPDWFVADDWECHCTPPATGRSGTRSPAAQCRVDECFENAKVCQDAGQVCEDVDTTTAKSWMCACPPHTGVTNSALMAPASCPPPAGSECLSPAIAKICTDKGQLCVDPNTSTANDWTCECVAPAVGAAAAGAPARCALDECVEDCSTCAATTCAAAGQTCQDPNTDATSVKDWECSCTAPRSGTNVAAPAVCQLDECTTVCDSCADHGVGNPCLRHNQTCVDPDTDARSTSDWMCVCKPANLGNATVGVALCVLDECEMYGSLVCKTDQACNDPNTAPDSLGDWTCTCLVAQGRHLQGFATATRANCTLNECANENKHYKCSDANQFCIDPNPLPGSLNDWECHCPQGTIAAVTKAAECSFDECVEMCPTCANNVCTAAGQTCLDPNKAADSKADWTCTCSTGAASAVANVAVCPLDECTMPGNYAAQTCEDTPRVTVEGCTCLCNWQSTSGLPPTASGPGLDTPCKAGCCNPDRRAGGDWCYVEDTNANRAKGCLAQTPLVCAGVAASSAAPVNVCTRGGQACVDRDTSADSQGDWQCECVAPATGAPQKLGLVATCAVDECEANYGVCEAAGQVCRDGTGSGDWECVCAAPATGSKLGGAATCAYGGECDDAAVAVVCTQAGQTCVDPDVTAKGDWLCACVGPTKGVSVKGAPAVCILDECTARCATCADAGFGNICGQAGQTCAEGSKSSDDVSDWRCVCPQGQFGQATTAVAVCRVDECLQNNGQFADLCGAAGQTCVDPNTKALGDWMCVCPLPGQGRATGKQALCRVDECWVPEIRDVCTQAGQQCVDTNPHSGALGDWACVCIADKLLQAVGKPADCHVPPTSWCGLNGKTCTDAGQTCTPAPVLTDVGHCACISPQTGAAQAGAPAQCELDECVTLCPTCADSGAGNVCEAHGQRCVEGSKHPERLKDWRCTCPGTGSGAVAAVARCSVNECDEAAAKQVCSGAEQVCVDPNTDADATGDWYCECQQPLVGGPRRVRRAATCTYDECLVHAATCQAHGQTCTDRNGAAWSRGDWACVCPPPATGTATGAAATCSFSGECGDAAKSKVCERAGQTCVDPDVSEAGDWECRCVAPQTGEAGKQAAATCILDECEMACPTCALRPGSRAHACAAAGQTCVDADTNPYSTGDWRCVCVAPQSGEQLGAAAVCNVDECADAETRKVCEAVTDASGDAVQLCRDPDTRRLGDWTCVCRAPHVGAAAARAAAVCTLDECSVEPRWLATGKNGDAVCGKAGQVCVDPQQQVGARDNWLCRCAGGGGGGAAVMKPVQSSLCTPPPTSLCAQHAGVCPTGQQCAESAGEWYCECVQPAVGRRQGGAATCTLDECTARCVTCAQQGSVHACAVAEQSCVDENTSAGSLGDWSCACETGVGEAMGQAATCVVDECEANGAVCTAARQFCTDPAKTAESTGDWLCHCERPAAGSATAGAAVCSHNECLEHAKTCAAAGQECVDENEAESRLGDWVCVCPPPATGSLVGGVAACTYKGGCEDAANREVCLTAGQKCVSVDAAWSCACIAPSLGAMGSKGPATCTLEECTSICPTCARVHGAAVQVCASAGQTCRDPNTSAHSLSDWVCECPAPSTGVAVGRPAEKCALDECVTVSQDGARKCEHFQRFTVQGCECACPWRVETNAPGFDGPGFSEDCVLGCCNPNSDPKGDWCMVAQTPYNLGIPACRNLIATVPTTCAGANAARPVGAPALVLPRGAPAGTVPNACTAVGQVCVDKSPTVSSLGDWECRCPFSDGKQLAAPVAACGIDECMQSQGGTTAVPASLPSNAKICTDAGQACFDPNTKTEKDWECRCSGSAMGRNVMAPVAASSCVYEGGDECKAASHRETCTEAGQGCFDPDVDRTGNWECRCMLPAVGAPGQQAAASCVLDECVAQCATCADRANGQGHTCANEGQLCVDPNKVSQSTGDWVCECTPPAIGKGVAAPATCVLDECAAAANSAVCVSAGQKCVDPEKTPAGVHDWECRCAGQGVGTGVMKPATCVVNECLEPAKLNVCATAGQTCFDPNTGEASALDYKCRCPAPASGEAVARAATCAFAGECSDVAKSKVCTDAGQTCVDPDASVAGDWMCSCVAPKSGPNGKQAVAECGTDECTARCPTCEAGVCTDAGQLCVDPDVKVAGDWLCRCVAPKKGDDVTTAVASCQTCEELPHEPACQAKAACMWVNGGGCTDMTPAPPTQTPPTLAPPTQAPPTQAPLTDAPPTQAPTTQAPTNQSTQAPTTTQSTPAPPTQAPAVIPQTETPALQCSQRNETDCEAPHCTWNAGDAECEAVSCADHTDRESCVLAKCLWDVTRPLAKCASPAPLTEAPPTQAPTTQAPTTQLTQAPTDQSTQAPTTTQSTPAPTTQAPAVIPQTEAPALQCSQLNETDCEASPHCTWNAGDAECGVSCADHTDRESCVLAKCLWDIRRPLAQCARCLWDPRRPLAECAPPVVPPRQCKDYVSDQEGCSDDERCKWDDAADNCSPVNGTAGWTQTLAATAFPETPLPASPSPGLPQPTDAPENGRGGCKRLRPLDDGSGVSAEVAVESCTLTCGTVYFTEGARSPYCDPCNGVPPGLFVTITRGDGPLHTVTYEKDGVSVPMKQNCGVCFTPRLGAGSVDVMIPCPPPPAPKSSPVLIIVAAAGGGVLLGLLCCAVYWFKCAAGARRSPPVFSSGECQATLLPEDQLPEEAFELDDLEVCAA